MAWVEGLPDLSVNKPVELKLYFPIQWYQLHNIYTSSWKGGGYYRPTVGKKH